MTHDDADKRLSRRRFVQLSAATGAALSLPGNATADAESDAFDAEYQFVLNHTPGDYAVPTLVTFSDAAGLTAFESLADTAVTTTEPRPAAYARLTTADAQAAAELPTAESFSFSPGSNPFWRIDYYPLGVFPEPTRSVDFVSYEQLTDGLAHLESEFPEKVRVQSIGQTPGHTNRATNRPDPKDIFVAEVTNYESEASFEEKEKIFYSCSLHGLERAGAEAGARIIENIARGQRARAGDGVRDEVELAGGLLDVLDDIVLIFGFTNPDGWAVRNPQYDSGWQVAGPGTGTPRAPNAPLYERGNAQIYDTNRQYPTVGYITAAHNPGEPEDAPGYIETKVPDALAIVEHFRDYENLTYGADLHGGPLFSDFVLGLISQDQYTLEESHEVYAMCEVMKENLDEALSEWQAIGDATETFREQFGNPQNPFGGTIPDDGFDYATIYDTIGYTVSGAMLDWMAHPEELGGLGMTTLDFEMSFSHMAGGNVFNPELLRMEVIGYREAIRTIGLFARQNSDTPNTADEFDTVVDTRVETSAVDDDAGERVAYVTTGEVGTDEDRLRRTNEDLNFASSTGVVDTFTASGTVGPGATGAETTATETFDTADLSGDPFRVEASLSWTPQGQDLEFYLRDPKGQQVGSAATASNPETLSASLEMEGTYTFVVETYANVASQYSIEAEFAGETAAEGTTTSESTQSTTLAADGVTTVSQSVPDGLHSLQVHTHAHNGIVDLELVSPSGETVRSFDGITDKRVGGKCCGFPEWDVAEPEAGEWTVRLTNLLAEETPVELRFGTLASASTNPKPSEVLGYEQREYDVTPFRFFEDYDAAIGDGGSMEPVTLAEVAEGALVDFDHAVVIHDFTRSGGLIGGGAADPAYTDALDQFVDDGGNLVLTDTGVNLLRELDNSLVGTDQFVTGDFTTTFQDVARYTEKDLSHPLMTDVRPIQNQLWKVAPLGYKVEGEAPNHLVGESAFTSGPAVGSVAGLVDGAVATGSLTPSTDDGTGIHVVGSLLPPASQSNLHPFGLLDYTVSYLGYLVFTSALGFEQVRKVGDSRTTLGRGDSFDVSGGSGDTGGGDEFTASGTRSDDGAVHRTGMANEVEVTLERTSADGAVSVTDSFDPAWTVVVSNGGTVDAETGTITFDGVSAGDTVSYIVEAPDTPGQYTFGPSQAESGGQTAEFGSQSDEVVVPGENSAGASLL